ncbi:MAG: hypothetical protein IPK81_19035 [Rhodospirillales bacterium]|nr:MAG: hypothetical protein IPK81_19035 [Rhodospirillales bacterium]
MTGDLITALEATRDAAGPDPVARMEALVRTHVLLHTDRRDEAFVANSELRSLRPADRAAVVAQRDKVLAIFRAVAAEGLAAGRFACAHPADTTIAILTMCTSVAGWFRGDGRETPATIADRYAALALRMLDRRDPAD